MKLICKHSNLKIIIDALPFDPVLDSEIITDCWKEKNKSIFTNVVPVDYNPRDIMTDEFSKIELSPDTFLITTTLNGTIFYLGSSAADNVCFYEDRRKSDEFTYTPEKDGVYTSCSERNLQFMLIASPCNLEKTNYYLSLRTQPVTSNTHLEVQFV